MSSRRMGQLALRFLVAGAVALVIGLVMVLSPSSETVTCNGQVMGPGDTCISTSDSHNGSYEELVARRREANASSEGLGPVLAVLGGLVVVGSALVLVASRREPLEPDRRGSGSDGSWW